MKIGCVLAAALVSLPMSESRAGCYGREDGRPQTRFMLRGSEALDTKTGLIWQRCSLGMTWDSPRGCVGERMVVGLDEAMRKAEEGGAKWRVPSGPELESIIDRSCGSPVVDVGVFPDIRKDEDGEADYWTTNPVGMANLYYFFDFMSGRADGHTRGFQMSVRLVRSKPTSDWKRTGNVRFGSEADIRNRRVDVRFTPKSGHC
jgi:Protein of unknown function (DUF1566)